MRLFEQWQKLRARLRRAVRGDAGAARTASGRPVEFPRLYETRLEPRQLLDGTPLAQWNPDGSLAISAGSQANDGQADHFEVRQIEQDGAARWQIDVNGQAAAILDPLAVRQVEILGSNDQDSLTVDAAIGPAAGLQFLAGGSPAGGSDSLSIVDHGAIVQNVNYSLSAAGSGQWVATGGAFTSPTLAIEFSGVEQVVDQAQAERRTVTLESQVSGSLLDDQFTQDGMVSFESSSGVTTTWLGSTDSLTIALEGTAAGSDARLTIAGWDAKAQSDLVIHASESDQVAVTGAVTMGSANLRVEGGVIDVYGSIHSSAGAVDLLGDFVHLHAGAVVDSSSNSSGGYVQIGGQLHGAATGIANASYVVIDEGATVRADATGNGAGGTIIVWSERGTFVFGELEARGGAAGGDGGFIETSSHGALAVTNAPNVGSAYGRGGTWLIDPNNLDIVTGGSTVNVTVGAGTVTTTDDDAKIGVNVLLTALATSDVVVTTASAGTNHQLGNITLSTPLDFKGIGTHKLTLQAHNDIIIANDIFNSVPSATDQLSLVLQSDSDGVGGGSIILQTTGIATSIATGGGSVTFLGPVVLQTSVSIDTTGLGGASGSQSFSKTIDADAVANQQQLTLKSGSSDITVSGAVGGTKALGAFTVLTGHDVQLNSVKTGGTVGVNTIDLGHTSPLNTVTLQGDLRTDGSAVARGIRIDAANIVVSNTSGAGTINLVTHGSTSDGTVTITGDGTMQSLTAWEDGLTIQSGSQAVDLSSTTIADLDHLIIDASAGGATVTLGAVTLGDGSASGGVGSLKVTASSAVLYRDISTAGDVATNAGAMTFNAAVQLANDVRLTTNSATGDGAITINGPVDADASANVRQLQLDAGSASINISGAVGANQALASFAILTAHDVTLSGVKTTGTVATNTIDLGVNASLNSLTLRDDLLTNVAADAGGLRINTNSITLNRAAGPGSIQLSTDGTATDGTLTFVQTPTITSSTAWADGLAIAVGAQSLDLSAFTFQRLDHLIVSNTSSVAFGSLTLGDGAASGGAAALSISTGTLTLKGNIATTGDTTNVGGAVHVQGAVTLAADVTLTTTATTGAGAISISGAVDADAVASKRQFTLDAGIADITLGGAIGASQALAAFSIISGHDVALRGVTTAGVVVPNTINLGATTALNALTLQGDLLTNATANAGGIRLNATQVTVDAAGGAGTIHLTTDSTASDGAITITGNGTVQSFVAWEDGLTLQSGSQSVDLSATTMTNLDHLIITASTTTATVKLGAVTLGDGAGSGGLGSLSVTAATTVLGGNLSTAGDTSGNAGALTLQSAVKLNSNVALTANAVGVDGLITITGAVDADAAANQRQLLLDAGTAATVLQGAAGSTQALGALTVASTGAVTLSGVRTTGTVTPNTINIGSTGAVSGLTLRGDLVTNVAANAGGVRIDTSTITLNRAGGAGTIRVITDGTATDGTLTLVQTPTITSATAWADGLTIAVGAQALDLSAVTFQQLDHLVVSNTSTVVLGALTLGDGAASGGAGALSISTGTLTLTGNIATTGDTTNVGGAVQFQAAVTLAANIALNTNGTTGDGAITVSGAVDADAVANQRQWSLDAGGADITLSGAVGANKALAAFAVLTGHNVTLSSVTTAGTAVTNTIDLGVTSALNTLTLQGDLRSDAAANAGGIHLNAASIAINNTSGTGTIRILSDGATSDGAVTFVGTPTLSSVVAWDDGLTIASGNQSVDLSGATVTNLDHLVITTTTAGPTVRLGSVTLGDGAGAGTQGSLAVTTGTLVLSGNISTAGDSSTNAGNVALAASVQLTNNVTMTTNAAGTDGTITISGNGTVQSLVAWQNGLSLQSGSQSVDLGATTVTNLDHLIIGASTATVTLGAVTVGDGAGSGGQGALSVTAATTVLSANLSTAGDSSGNAGSLSLQSAVRLKGNVLLTSNSLGADGQLTISGAVDADAVANQRQLQLDSGSAGTVLSNAVGSNQALAVFTVASTGAVTLSGVLTSGTVTPNTIDIGASGAVTSLTLQGDLATNASANAGGLRINASSILLNRSGGPGTIRLNTDGATSDGNLTFVLPPTITSATAWDDGLTLMVGTKALDLSTFTFQQLDHLVVNNTSTVALGALTLGDGAGSGGAGALSISTGTVTLTGNIATTGDSSNVGGAVQVQGSVKLAADLLINTNSVTIDGSVTVSGAIDADAVANLRQLSIDTGSADVTLNGAVGGNQALAAFKILTGRNVTLNGVTTAGTVVVNTIDLGVTSALNTLTLQGDLRSDAAANAGGIRLHAANIAINNTSGAGTIRILSDGATSDGAVTFVGVPTLSSVVAWNDGLTIASGSQSVDLSGATVTNLDHLVITTTTAGPTVRLGSVTLGDGAGSSGPGSLSVTTTTVLLGGNISTAGDSSSNAGAVALHAAVQLTNNVTITTNGAGTDDAITIDQTTNADAAANQRQLNLDAGTGNVQLGGAVGQAQALGALVIQTGGNVTLPSVLTTGTVVTNTINIGAANAVTSVTLQGDLATNAAANAGGIRLNSSLIRVDYTGGAGTIQLITDGSGNDGAITLSGGGMVQSVTPWEDGLTLQSGSQSVNLTATTIANLDHLIVNINPVGTTVSLGAMTLGDGAASGGAGSLAVTAGLAILSGSISTTGDTTGNAGAMNWNAALQLNGNVTLSTNALGTDQSITINQAVNADVAANQRQWTLDAGSGDVSLNATVGGSQALGAVVVASAKNVTLSKITTTGNALPNTINVGASSLVSSLTLQGDLLTNASANAGGIRLNATQITVDAAGGAGTLHLTTDSTGSDGAITIMGNGTVQSLVAWEDGLTLQSGSQSVDLSATTMTSLDHLIITASTATATVTLGAVTLGDGAGSSGQGALSVTAATTVLGGNLSTAGDTSGNAGALTLQSAVKLNSSVALSANAVGVDGPITITGAVDADAAANQRQLLLDAGAAATVLQGAVGSTQALGALTVASTGAVTLSGVHTTGTVTPNTINIGSTGAVSGLTLRGDLVTNVGANAGGVRIDSNTITLNRAGGAGTIRLNTDGTASDGALTLVQTPTITSATAWADGLTLVVGAQALDLTAITFQQLDHLVVSNTSTVVLSALTLGDGAASGGAGALSVSTGTLTLTGNIATTGDTTNVGGAVQFQAAVTLAANIALNTNGTTGDGSITVSGAVDADAVANLRQLSIDTGSADVTLSGAVGANQALASFTVLSGHNVTLNGVTTAGTVVANTIDLGVTSALNTLTLQGDLRSDAAANAGGIRLNAANIAINNTSGAGTIRILSDGATSDGAVTFAGTPTVSSVVAWNDGLTIASGSQSVDLSGATVTNLDHLVITTTTAGPTVRLGSVTLGDGAGSGGPGSLAVTTTTVLLGGNISTAGDSSSNAGAVALHAAVQLTNNVTITTNATGTDSAITIDQTTNADAAANQRQLNLDAGTGNVQLVGAVGQVQALGALVIQTGGNVTLPSVLTTGTVVTNTINIGATSAVTSVTLQGDLATNAAANAGGIRLNSSLIRVDYTGGAGTIQLVTDGTGNDGAITLAGGGMVQSVTAWEDGLTLQSGSQSVNLTATTIANLDHLIVNINPVGTTVSLGAMTLGDGAASGGAGSLAVTAGLAILSGSISTTGDTTGNAGAMNWNAALQLNGKVTLSTNALGTDQSITINQAVNADAAANQRQWTLDAGSGDVALNAIVGGSQALGAVVVASAKNVTLSKITTTGNALPNTINIGSSSVVTSLTLQGDLLTNASANAGGIRLSAAQIKVDAAGGAGTIHLTTDSTGSDGAITITGNGTVQSLVAWEDGLTLQSGSQSVDLSATTMTNLDHLIITASTATATVTLGAVTLGDGAGSSGQGALSVTAATTVLGGNLSTAGDTSGNAGALTLQSAVKLNSSVALSANAVGVDGPITITGAVDADAAANQRQLLLDAGAAATVLQGAVGSTQALGALTVASNGAVTLSGVHTTGTVTPNTINIGSTGAVSGLTLRGDLVTNVAANAGGVRIDSNTITLNRAGGAGTIRVNTDGTASDGTLTLVQTPTITSTTAWADGLTLVVGAQALDLTAITFQQLDHLVVSNTSTVVLSALTLGDGAASGGAGALSVSTGTLTLTGNIATTGDTTNDGGAVQFQAAVTLAANVALNTNGTTGDGSITVSGAVDADAVANQRQWSLDAGGADITLSNAVGANQALASFTVLTGHNVTLNGVTTAGTVVVNTIDLGVTSALNTLTLQGDLRSDAAANAGGIRLNAVNIAINNTSGAGTIRILSDSATSDGAVTFVGTPTVSSVVAWNDGLTIASGSQSVDLSGATVTNLDHLVITTTTAGPTVRLGSVTLGDGAGSGGQGSLAVTTTTVLLGGNISTAGDSSTNAGTVALHAAVQLTNNVTITTNAAGTDGAITIDQTTNADVAANQRQLTVDAGAGSVQFVGAVGQAQALGALVIQTGGNVTLPSVLTTGTVVTNTINIGATSAVTSVTLQGDLATNAAANAGGIRLNSSLIRVDNTGGAGTIQLVTDGTGNDGAITLAGGGTVQSVTPWEDGLTLQSGSQSVNLTATTIANLDHLIVNINPVGTTVSLGAMTLGDGAASGGAGSLAVTAGLAILSGSISTTGDTTGNAGAMNWNAALQLNGNVTLSTNALGTDQSITINQAVNADVAANQRQWTLDAGSGDVALNATVGGSQALGAVVVASAKNVTLSKITTTGNALTNTINIGSSSVVTSLTLQGDLLTNASANAGGIRLNAAQITVDAAGGAGTIRLTTDGASSDGAITIMGNGTVQSFVAWEDGLTLSVGDATVQLAGTTIASLDHLVITTSLNAPAVTLGNITLGDGAGSGGQGSLAVTTAVAILSGAITSTGDTSGDAGAITFHSAVTLNANVSINSNANGIDGAITIDQAVNADAAANQRQLSLSAGSADIVIQGAVGGSQALGAFTISTAQDVLLNGVTTTGGTSPNTIDLGATGALTSLTLQGDLRTNATSQAGGIRLNVPQIVLNYGGGVGSITINTDGSATDGALTWIGSTTVGSATPWDDGLAITTGTQSLSLANVTLNGLDHLFVSNSSALTLGTLTLGDGAGNGGVALEVNSQSLTLNSQIDTTGDSSQIGGSVVLDAAVTLAGNTSINTAAAVGAGNIHVLQAINADAAANHRVLTLNTGTSDIAFDGAVGGSQALGALVVNSAGNVTLDDVTTGGTTFSDTINLGAVSAVSSITLQGNLATNAEANAAGIRLNSQQVRLDYQAGAGTIRWITDGAANDGAITVVGGASVQSQQAWDDGLTLVSGDGAVNLGSATLTKLDHLIVTSGTTGTTVQLGSIVLGDGAGSGGLGSLVVTAQNVVLTGSIDAAGDTTLVSGAVLLDAAVTLASNVSIVTNASQTDATITLTKAVNADLASNLRTLSLDAGNGDIAVNGAIGNSQALGALVIQTARNITLYDVTTTGKTFASTIHLGAVNTLTSVTQRGDWRTNGQANSGDIVVNAGQLVVDHQNGAGTLVMNTDGGGSDGKILFSGGTQITSSVAWEDGLSLTSGDSAMDLSTATVVNLDHLVLTANVATGAVTLGAMTLGDGAASGGLGSLSVTANTALVQGNLSSAGDTTGVAGDITFHSAVVLGANVTWNTNAVSADGRIVVEQAINADAVANGRQLGLTAGAGDVDLQGAIGGTRALGAFLLNSAKDVVLSGVTTAGVVQANTIQIGAVTTVTTVLLRGDLVTSAANQAGGIRLNVGTILIDNPSGAGTVRWDTDGAASDGAITVVGSTTISSQTNWEDGLSIVSGTQSVSLASATIQSLDHLVINNSANVSLGAMILGDGAAHAGTALAVTANKLQFGGDVDTTGDSTQNAGAVALDAATTLATNVRINTNALGVDGAVTSLQTIDADSVASGRTLTIDVGGAAIQIASAIGSQKALGQLTIQQAGNVQLANVTTAGASASNTIDIGSSAVVASVVLRGDLSTIGANNAGGIRVNSQQLLVDHQGGAGTVQLITNASAADGAITILGPAQVGSVTAWRDGLTLRSGQGTIDISSATVTNLDHLVIDANSPTSTVTLGAMTLGDGTASSGQGGLSVTAGTAILGGNIATNGDASGNAGNMNFHAKVELVNDVVLDANAAGADGKIVADQSVDADAVVHDRHWTVDAGSNDVVMQGALGSIQALGAFTIRAANNVTLNDVTTAGTAAVNTIDIGSVTAVSTLLLQGDLQTDATAQAGGLQIHANSILINRAGGAGTIRLITDGSSGDGVIRFIGSTTIASVVAWNDGITLQSGSQGVDLTSLTFNSLDHLSVSAATVNLGTLALGDGAGNSGDALRITGNLATLYGDISSQGDTSNVSGNLEFHSALRLAGNVTFSTVSGGANGQIVVDGAVDADAVANLRQWTINAASKDVTIRSPIGATNALGSLVIQSAQDVVLNGVATAGNSLAATVDLGANSRVSSVTLGGDVLTNVAAQAGGIRFNANQLLLDHPNGAGTIQWNTDGTASDGALTIVGPTTIQSATAGDDGLTIITGTTAVNLTGESFVSLDHLAVINLSSVSLGTLVLGDGGGNQAVALAVATGTLNLGASANPNVANIQANGTVQLAMTGQANLAGNYSLTAGALDIQGIVQVDPNATKLTLTSTNGNLHFDNSIVVPNDHANVVIAAKGNVQMTGSAAVVVGTSAPTVANLIAPSLGTQPLVVSPGVNIYPNGLTSITVTALFPTINPQPIDQLINVSVNWADGTSPDQKQLAQSGNQTTFDHAYQFNPSSADPTAPIKTLVTATYDRVQFFEGGNAVTTQVTVTLNPSANGMLGFSVVAPPVLPTSNYVPPRVQPFSPTIPSAPPISAQRFDFSGSTGAASEVRRRQLILHVVSLDENGDPQDSPQGVVLDRFFPGEDVLGNLPRLFQMLRDDRYRIYLQLENGTKRPIKDFILKDHKAVELETDLPGVAAPPEDVPALDLTPRVEKLERPGAAPQAPPLAPPKSSWQERVRQTLAASAGRPPLRVPVAARAT